MKDAKSLIPLIASTALVAPYAAVDFLNGLCPQPQFGLLSLATGILALVGWIGGLVVSGKNQKLTARRCVYFALLATLGTQLGYVGYQFRPMLFERLRPGLSKAASMAAMESLQTSTEKKILMPEELSGLSRYGTVQGEAGHRQLTIVIGGYYMTAFYAYIWRQDGTPPTSALQYRIDDRDKVTPRGDGWFEALVSNGH